MPEPTEIPRFGGFAELLAARVAEAPDARAFLREGAEGPEAVSWAGFAADVSARAEALRAARKTCEAVLADGSYASVVEVFAANAAGLTVVMLESSMSDVQVGQVLGAVSADAVWCANAGRAAMLELDLGYGVEDGAGKVLFFTSGTTARSKAVVLTDASLMASAWNGSAMLPLSSDDVLLACLPMAHVFGFVCGLLWGLNCGATVALGRGVRHYTDDLAYFAPTAVAAVPALLSFFVIHQLVNPELRLVLVGAGDCEPRLLADAKALGLRVSFGYGLTELSSGVALSVGDDPFAMSVCPEPEIRLADDGEILVRAPSVMMQGYLGDIAATNEVLVDGELHTGDIGSFDENGCLHITGRKKEILVLPGGTKIYLPEYETRIAQELGTYDIAVLLHDGKPWLVTGMFIGHRQKVLEQLAPLMAEYPREQQLAGMEILSHELPRTATGKLKRWEIQKEFDRLW